MEFTLKLKPLSLNHAYRNNRQGIRFKTDRHKGFIKLFNYEISPHLNELKELFKAFEPGRHCIHMHYEVNCPIMTKKGVISERSGDVSNFTKLIEDNLFIHGVDDSQVTRMVVSKRHSEEVFTRVRIELVEL